MRVLHLFSNAKFTGPAEPALNLCVALRRLGVEVDLAFPDLPPDRPHTLRDTARDRDIEPLLQFRLPKHYNPVLNFFESRTLRRYLRTHIYDLIHCHLDNDHRIAVAAVGGGQPPVIRSNYSGLGFEQSWGRARLLRDTAWLIEPSRRALDHDHETFGYPAESMQVVQGAVDVERFDPAREVPDGRRWLGIPQGAFVVGIVARMQTHRRYEDFFASIRRLVDSGCDAHAIVVGRGTHQDSVGKAPAERLGLKGRVHFPGYATGENYVGLLKAFDVKVFLVPGSDGTCRAVREAMAMGKPAIVSDRGMLPEIVDHGEDGFVCDGSAESLYEILARLAKDRRLRHALGRAARNKAVTQFSLDVQARAVLNVYERVLSRREPTGAVPA